eukprot:9772628-Ditylum_brightwellii.AAC.1
MDRLRLEYTNTPHVAKEHSATMSQTAMVPILCCYNKVPDSFFRWIADSDKKLLGDIEAYWSAAECQEIGNKLLVGGPVENFEIVQMV